MIGDYRASHGAGRRGLPNRQVLLVVLPHSVLMEKEYGIFRRTQLTTPRRLARPTRPIPCWGLSRGPLKTASLSRLPVRP